MCHSCIQCLLAAAVFSMTISASADYDTSGYIKLEKSDASTNPSFAAAGNWSSKAPPSVGGKYLVPKNVTLYTRYRDSNKVFGDDPGPFKGDVLAVAGILYMFNDKGTVVPELHLLDYGRFDINNHSYYIKDSCITVYSAANPFCFRMNPNYSTGDKARCLVDKCTLKGAKGTCLKLSVVARKDAGFRLRDLQADGFSGVLRFAMGELATSGCSVLENVNCGGVVEVGEKIKILLAGSGATLDSLAFASASGIELNGISSLSVKNLALGAGTTIELSNCTDIRPISVSGSLSVSGKVNLRIPLVTDGPARVRVLKVNGTGKIDSSMFHVDPFGMDAILSVGTEDGCEVLFADIVKAVKLDKYVDNTYENSCFLESQKDCWSDKSVMGSDRLYYNSGFYMSVPDSTDWTFPGRTLMLTDLATFYARYNSATFNISDFRMQGNTHFEGWTGRLHLKGKLTLGAFDAAGSEAAVNFFERNNGTVVFDSSLCGNGTMRLTMGYRAKDGSEYVEMNNLADPRANYAITGKNADFRGRILVTAPSQVYANGELVGPSDTHCVKLWLSAPANLGATRDSFVYDALKLENYGQLNITNDFALADGSIGVCISNVARINIAQGCALALSSTVLTLDGTLRKEGAGMLVLGGSMRFGDGAPGAVPVAGRNIVAVEKGALKPASTNCMDGAVCRFSAGSELAYDIEPAADGMAEFGPVMTKGLIDEPIAVESGKLSVRIIADGDIPEKGTVALGTFKDAAVAGNLKAVLDVRRIPGRNAELKVRENADSTATLLLGYSQSAFVITVR